MKHFEEIGSRRTGPSPALLLLLVLLSVGISLAAALFFDQPFLHQSLFKLSNLVGPTTQSLLHGGGLTVCTTEMGTPGNPICFHSGRMPLPSLIIAVGIRLFGDSFLRVAIFKTLLFLLPIEFSIWLVWKRMPQSGLRQMLIVLLLIAPFEMTPFLANVVNLQVEEAYAYSLLAFAVAILFFGPSAPPRSQPASDFPGYVILFALAIDALYLSKSSMILVAAILTLAFFLQLRSSPLRFLVLALVAAAPLGWALHQHHASGRYSLGTSLDGINLHKANVDTFLAHYPPPSGTSLDQYDAGLNRGLTFPDEWTYNDFHQHTALAYIRTHPSQIIRGDARKLWVLFFSLTKYGSTANHGLLLAIEIAGLLLFRIILWIAIGYSVIVLLRPSKGSQRAPAAAFLAIILASIVPYIAGFAYTRHASILVYPACLICCRALCSAASE